MVVVVGTVMMAHICRHFVVFVFVFVFVFVSSLG